MHNQNELTYKTLYRISSNLLEVFIKFIISSILVFPPTFQMISKCNSNFPSTSLCYAIFLSTNQRVCFFPVYSVMKIAYDFKSRPISSIKSIPFLYAF